MARHKTDKTKGKMVASSARKVMRDAKSGHYIVKGSGTPRSHFVSVKAKVSSVLSDKGGFAGGGVGEPVEPLILELSKLLQRMTGQAAPDSIDTVEISRRVAEAEQELAFIKESLAQVEMDRLIDVAGDDIQDVLDRLEDR